MTRAYYNEFDPRAAAWLRELIKQGHIAPGDVDERSIEDVTPNDLRGYTQCHFFAGIGGWSYALRRAGWLDDAPIWTGSCPCQPFSSAGKGSGFDDERHLWPAMHYLLEQCRPPVWLGEQVASKDGLAWLDLVQADMEATGYSGGAVDLCAAGVGAPHIRQRLWLGYASREGLSACERQAVVGTGRGQEGRAAEQPSGAPDRMANPGGAGRQELRGRPGERQPPLGQGLALVQQLGGLEDTSGERRDGEPVQLFGRGQDETVLKASGGGASSRLADAERDRLHGGGAVWTPGRGEPADSSSRSAVGGPGPTNGLWRNADWLGCRDGKWRPVEPGAFPLAHGVPGRVGLLRGYGNAINAEAATEFIKAFLATIC